MNRTPHRTLAALTALALAAGLTATSGQATAQPIGATADRERTTPYPVHKPPKTATSVGYGGFRTG